MTKRVCVFGAGAIGCQLALHLTRGGCEVSIVARGPQLKAIEANGVVIERPDGASEKLVLSVSAKAADLGPQDLVVMAVKTFAVPQALQSLGPLLGPATPVIAVMNGLPFWYGRSAAPHEHPHGVSVGESRHPTVDNQRVIGGVVYAAGSVIEPGVVRADHERKKLVIGELDGEVSPRAKEFARWLSVGGMPCVVSSAIRDEVWLKLLTNFATGPLCLLARRDMRTILADPLIAPIAASIVEEGMAIAHTVLGHPIEASANEVVAMLAQTAHKPSILQDVERGRPTEFEALFSAPLRLARDHGVPTPLLEAFIKLAALAISRGVAHRPPA